MISKQIKQCTAEVTTTSTKTTTTTTTTTTTSTTTTSTSTNITSNTTTGLVHSGIHIYSRNLTGTQIMIVKNPLLQYILGFRFIKVFQSVCLKYSLSALPLATLTRSPPSPSLTVVRQHILAHTNQLYPHSDPHPHTVTPTLTPPCSLC